MSRKAKPLTSHINIRVDRGQFTELHKKSAPDGGVSVVMRQMVEAYLDGRMFIKPKLNSLNQS